MAVSSAALQPPHGYQLRLPVFEGPLDVLLRLIERDQLEISEVSLLAVFDQFVSYVHAIETAPPGVIAEFAAVVGRLSVLKSRALLPKPPKSVEDGDEPDLVRQLAEYRALKAAADILADRQKDGSGAFGRGEGVGKPEPVLHIAAPLPSVALSRALNRWLTRIPVKPALLASRPVVSLREMLATMSSILDRDDAVTFRRLCANCASRQDVSVAFLALLTLIRRQVVNATQTERFGPIVVTRADREPSPLRRAIRSQRAGEDDSV